MHAPRMPILILKMDAICTWKLFMSWSFSNFI